MKPAFRITGTDLQDLLKRLAKQPETGSRREPARKSARKLESRNAERPYHSTRSRVPSRQGAAK